MNPAILAAAERLEAEALKNPFSEQGVNFIFHDGLITRVEYSSVIKMKPQDKSQGGKHEFK